MAIKNDNEYYDNGVAIANRVNVSGSSAEKSASQKTALETLYSDSNNGIVAKVITATGNYLKIKFLKNGKKIGFYKSRNYVQDDVMTGLDYMLANNKHFTPVSAASTLAVTGTNTITGTGTSQFTATLTRADSSTEDVSSKATWSSGTPAHATVSSSGLVTGVAAGTSVITATYAGKSNTRTVTVS